MGIPVSAEFFPRAYWEELKPLSSAYSKMKLFSMFLATSSYDGMDDAPSREIPTSPWIPSLQGATAKCTNPATTSRYINVCVSKNIRERVGEEMS